MKQNRIVDNVLFSEVNCPLFNSFTFAKGINLI